MRHPTVLFSIDGMRPDGLQQASTPFIDRLIATGSSTMTARTVMPSVTLPCHTSMHRGVEVSRHGITSNIFQPLARPVPSLFDVAKAQGLTTAAFYNWGELRDLMSPGSVDFTYALTEIQQNRDSLIAQAAVDHIVKQDIDLFFIYFGFTDTCGHMHGWMSDPYLEAISEADRCVGQVLQAFEQRAQTPNLLLLSDHGGHERTHGTDMPEDMTIPWVMHGPDVRAGYQIQSEVRIFDACTTVASLARLTHAREWEGKVIREGLL